ncbi:hypothetical protein KZC51_01775 [Microbacterium sp. SSW1-49]|uniref:Uncharacterized protein n=1 Tax=Microbacterium croceum TaxID=2851645 RepID=A0ABT0F9X7_9MICO|nr:hypothetical protein [Microbacterium croceum]MCK2034852.1 hypothetical protein [Microbacterium croceum]
MTTLRVANELAAVLVPIGVVGAALAALCAIVAGIAIMRGAGGLIGGAVGLWIPFALLSLTASFANQWLPLIASVAALAAMLVLGGVARAIVNVADGGRPSRRPVTAPVAVGAPVVSTVKSSPVTSAIPIVSTR